LLLASWLLGWLGWRLARLLYQVKTVCGWLLHIVAFAVAAVASGL
jgi:hypothetical protein